MPSDIFFMLGAMKIRFIATICYFCEKIVYS